MKLSLLLSTMLLSFSVMPQNVAINNNSVTAHNSAMLDVSSDTKGMLIPRMRTMRRLDITSPATGLLVYDTDTNSFWFYNNGWKELKQAGSSDSIWTKTGDSIYTVSSSYKTGIGTSTPAEKLDVNGNINLQGNLKINGAAGQEGQVLMTNAAGATQWTDLCNYKKAVFFNQNGSWTVPAGVTKVVIEMWGGGGGGAEGGGGASGTYGRTSEQTVAPGDIITVSLGAGGTGGIAPTGSANNGGITSVNSTNPFVGGAVPGGGGSTQFRPGLPNKFNLPGSSTIEIPGNGGEATAEDYRQYGAGNFATIKKYGDGGNPVMINSYNGGRGAYITFDSVTLAPLFTRFSTSACCFGGGGGSGTTNGGSSSSNGALGAVIIHY